jgi:hypothetical protein
MDVRWERIGKGLQNDTQDIVGNHVPERWIELINRFNAEEELATGRKEKETTKS